MASMYCVVYTGVEIFLSSVLCQYNYCGSVGNCAGIVLGLCGDCVGSVRGVCGEYVGCAWDFPGVCGGANRIVNISSSRRTRN